MDIDPLKPKNVPLAADIVLWFEFLLNPQLLTNHLNNPNAEPSDVELLSQFLSIAQEIPIDISIPEVEVQDDSFEFNRKGIALKILTLKIAAHLQWNLEKIEKHLLVRRQIQLLGYLCTTAVGRVVNLPQVMKNQTNIEIGENGSDEALKFAFTMVHLWILRLPVVRSSRIKNNNLTMEKMHENMRDACIVETFTSFVHKSIEFLSNLEQCEEPFRMLTPESFVPLDVNSENTRQNFDATENLSKTELRTQINFDLCSYYLHVRKYDMAKMAALRCKDNFCKLKEEYGGGDNLKFKFCLVTDEMIYGLLLACGIEKKHPGLFERAIESNFNKLANLESIFREDNLIQEIPIVNRRIFELDIQPAISCGIIKPKTDIQMHTIALNTIRCVIDGSDIVPYVDFMQKYKSPKDFHVLVQAAGDILASGDLKIKHKLKMYFMNILMTNDQQNVEMGVKALNLFSEEELVDLRRQKNDMDIEFPAIAMQVDWKLCDVKNKTLERIQLERQLMACFTPISIRKYLVKLAAFQPMKPVWGICHGWNLPVPLRSTLKLLQEGFLQDFAYILIGKSRELRAKKDYVGAINLMNVLKTELKRPEIGANNPAVATLSVLVSFEILLFEICQALEDWPYRPNENPEMNTAAVDRLQMIQKCKQCLLTFTNSDNVIPRPTILENCASMLLNLNDWNSVIFTDKRFPDKRFPSMELISVFANVGFDKEKYKGGSKKCLDCWNHVLSMFANSPAPAASKNRNISRDSPTPMIKTNLTPFIKRLRDHYLISVVISLLARLHNILKDESNLDLNAEYMFFWPTSVSNANGYNIKMVSDTLNTLLQQALKFYPTNLTWIKLKGDLEFVNGNYESAMKHYVSALIIQTDFGTLHPQRTFDDFIIRRMIKCSTNLGCHMQAAVLCQFLNEIDYSLAFKNISEKTSSSTDAMDAYYTCIWDPTILEFIVNLHSKKGEHTRKLQAINYMGQLELNANNNEEIKYEAADIRKRHFVRALAKQYVL